MLAFLEDLGHPEQSFPAVHVAGTSGKGSTALMIAEVLHSAGYKVGLHTSPYLQVATEKIWVDGKYISVEDFCELVDWIRPTCEKWRAPEVPLHAMAGFGICLEHFRRENVDIAVIETSCGGKDDITNVLRTCLSVITPIGIDHVKTLGNTIEKIAEHKAGIIKPGVPVVAFKGDGWDVVERDALGCNTVLLRAMSSVEQKSSSPRRRGSPAYCVWETPDQVRGDKTLTPRSFFSINQDLATTSAHTLRNLGYTITDADIEEGVAKARLPGRLEIVQENPRVILDGAHNFQKLSALFQTIGNNFGTLIFGMIGSKENPDIFKLLRKIDKKIILTEPQAYGKPPFPAEKLREMIGKNCEIIKDPLKAVDFIKDTTLITGSLYLIGNVRERFYPSEKILGQRTSWPS